MSTISSSKKSDSAWDDILSKFQSTYIPTIDPHVWNRFASYIKEIYSTVPTASELKKIRDQGQGPSTNASTSTSNGNTPNDQLNSSQTQSMLAHFKENIRQSVEDEEFASVITQAFSDCIVKYAKAHKQILRFLSIWVQSNADFLAIGEHLIPCYLQDIAKNTPFYFGVLKEKCKDNLPPGLDHKDLVEALRDFLQRVACYNSQHITRRVHQKACVLIFTGTGGGGHISQAKGIENFLVQKMGYEVHTVDANTEIAKSSCDPLTKVGAQFEDGTPMSLRDVYQRWTAPGNDAHALRNEIAQQLSVFLSNYFPKDYAQDDAAILLKKVQEIGPHLIFSNISTQCIPSLAFRTKLPLENISADYQPMISPHIYLRELSLPLHLRLVRFGMPDALVMPEAYSKEHDLVDIVGYPTRSSFHMPDVKDLPKMREKWGVRPTSRVLTLSRGFLGSRKHIMEDLDSLLTSQESLIHQWDIIVVCGNNQQLLDELKGEKSPLASCDALRFIVVGLLDATEMAEVTHIADVVDIKAGGATTNEFFIA